LFEICKEKEIEAIDKELMGSKNSSKNQFISTKYGSVKQ